MRAGLLQAAGIAASRANRARAARRLMDREPAAERKSAAITILECRPDADIAGAAGGFVGVDLLIFLIEQVLDAAVDFNGFRHPVGRPEIDKHVAVQRHPAGIRSEAGREVARSEEHTAELQSLMRN